MERSFRSEAIAPVLLGLLPILVKFPFIVGAFRANPMLLVSGIQQDVKPGLLGGFPPLPTIDPNVGFTSQALGHRAALDILSGHMPWWNPFEGVGVPLAGEMQSAALFPLTWLLAFPNGQLIEHLTLQVIAGLSTWFLLRQLRLGRLPAFAGAAVFAFNGVFAWLANAVINPVPFLPMILLGIERAAAHPQRRWTGGGAWISVGIAASLYGGFPEVAYLNGLLAVAWVLARACVLAPDERWRFLTRVAAAGITGLLIAAPVLIAFADYLRVADLDTHAGMGFLSRHLEPGDLVVMALPWLYGGLFFDPGHRHFWGDVGGYGGCTLFILAFAGVFGRGRRGLRLVLAGWVVVALAVTFGAPISPWLAYVIPGLKQIALYRYLPASWIMCLCVLAAFALDDVATADRAAPGRGRAIAAGLALLIVLLGCALLVPGATSPPFLVNAASRRTTALAALSLLGLAIVLTPRRIPRDRRVAGVAAILVGEALTWFILPTFYAPRGGTIDLDGVGFLRDHLGLQRFATLGPIAPNYGAWFGIAGINHNDLPMPSAWSAYVRDHLDRNATSTIFNGINREDPGGPSAVEELIANRAGYASSGVRYVVAAPDQTIPLLREVFRGRKERVYEIQAASPYFAAEDCRLDVRDRTHLVASCDHPSTLIRLEMAMPGWHAEVAGEPAEVMTIGQIFQSVTLPAGESVVSFAFEPPFMRYGYAAFAAGLLILTFNLARHTGARRAAFSAD